MFGIDYFSFFLILRISKNKLFDKWVNKKLSSYLKKYSKVELADYANLLHLGDKYGIGEVFVSKDHWFSDSNIKDLSLTKEGLIILGVQTPSGEYLGLPSLDYIITAGDTVLLYGHADMLNQISERQKEGAEVERKEAIERMREIKKEEKEREEGIVDLRDDQNKPNEKD